MSAPVLIALLWVGAALAAFLSMVRSPLGYLLSRLLGWGAAR